MNRGMEETEITGHLLELSRSLDDYRAAVDRMKDLYKLETEQLWRDQAALRDELHESVTALSNRIEGAMTRADS